MELHVAGVLARTHPGRTDEVTTRLAGLPGTEVHAASADGKIVLTLEAFDAITLSERLAGVQHVSGVLSAVLVYQHHEPWEASRDGSS